jgi:SAM-dependent methyltransferase
LHHQKNELEYQKKAGTKPLDSLIYHALKDVFLTFYPPQLFSIILDIGCGEATFQSYLPKYQWIGIDLCNEHLLKAKKNNPSSNFICADLFYLPFKHGKISLVTSIFTLHHVFNQWQEAIASIHRICNNFLFLEPNADSELCLLHYAVEKTFLKTSEDEWPIPCNIIEALLDKNDYYGMVVPYKALGTEPPMIKRIREYGYKHKLLESFTITDANTLYFMLVATQNKELYDLWIRMKQSKIPVKSLHRSASTVSKNI